ncbi:hypothetical protein O6H91_Y372000 [Diphasiastrum complanatum]|nr:hypothetical protein O6H91_Y372000 [Diphasiastrum complanatum]
MPTAQPLTSSMFCSINKKKQKVEAPNEWRAMCMTNSCTCCHTKSNEMHCRTRGIVKKMLVGTQALAQLLNTYMFSLLNFPKFPLVIFKTLTFSLLNNADIKRQSKPKALSNIYLGFV